MTTVIGSDNDAADVISLVFTHMFGQVQRGPVVVLSSQLKPAWLPLRPLVSFVFVTDAKAATWIANGGTYWSIDRVGRNGKTVSISLHQQCGGTMFGHVVSR